MELRLSRLPKPRASRLCPRPQVTQKITPTRIENVSSPFTPILWFYVSGYRFPSYLSGYGVSEINDEQTWSAFWSQVSKNTLPGVDFQARTVLLASAPIFPFGTYQFNVTRVFRTDSPLSCSYDFSPVVIFSTECYPVTSPTLHVEVDGRTTGPGLYCAFPQTVMPPRFLVEVLEIHKTTLPAALVTTSVQIPYPAD